MGSLNPENLDLDDSGCYEDAYVYENYRGVAQLLDLSDDVLLGILKYCSPKDLKALGHCCPRLGRLVCDRTLWKRVDARDQPVGELRLRWLLTHCLSESTTELQISGFANKYSRCLGIQEMHLPGQADQEYIRSSCAGAAEGLDVEHLLLRMWYPHLPRFTVSPRWPDKAEAERKAAKAAEASTSKSEPSTSTAKSDEKPGCSGESRKPVPGSCPSCRREFGCMDSKKSAEDSDKKGRIDTCAGLVEIKRERDDDDDCSVLFEDEIWDDCKGPHFTLTKHLMRELRRKCTHLTTLTLEYCNIDYKKTNLQHFPITLKRLSMRGSRCYNLPLNVSFMGKAQERLPHLEYLNVSQCDWFEPASLMPLSKLANLTELHMRDCKRLTECVAYASLSTRYGFRKLRVFDVRGSPLADSEVSALGWLPCLEELYVSPPEEFNVVTEHTHSWNDLNNVFNELDYWELKEPEYYKVKSPEPEMEDDDKDETENEKAGEARPNNPWWAHERRIIVIQPNANRQLEERYPLAQAQGQMQPQGPLEGIAPQDLAQGAPGPPFRPRNPRPQPDPAVPQQPEEPIRGDAEFIMVPDDPEQGAGNPQQRPRPPRSIPGYLNPSPYVLAQYAQMAQMAAARGLRPQPLQPGFANPRSMPAQNRPGPANPQPGPANPQQGPSNPQPGPANPQPGPSNPQPGPSSSQPGPSNPRPGPANAGESGTIKRRLHVSVTIDLTTKRRRLEEEWERQMQEELEEDEYEDDEDVDMQAPPAPPINDPELCPRLRIRDISRMGEPGRIPHTGRGTVNYARHLNPDIDPTEPIPPSVEPPGPRALLNRSRSIVIEPVPQPQPDVEPEQPVQLNLHPPRHPVQRAQPVQPDVEPEQPVQLNLNPPRYPVQRAQPVQPNVEPEQPVQRSLNPSGSISIEPVQPVQPVQGCSNPDIEPVQRSLNPSGSISIVPVPGCSNPDIEPVQRSLNLSGSISIEPVQPVQPVQGCSNPDIEPVQRSLNPSGSISIQPAPPVVPGQQSSKPDIAPAQPVIEPAQPDIERAQPVQPDIARAQPDIDRAQPAQPDTKREQPDIERAHPAQPNIEQPQPAQPDIAPEQPPPPQRPRVTFRRNDYLHPIMHIDIDSNRQSTVNMNDSLPGNHLVTDSAILRFGRAENENVNYVHIGRNGVNHGPDSGSRPDRSNLRILSVTGYRNVTDRSLEHLVTAAPFLRHIDFSGTNVTPHGVEMFNIMRPHCNITFSMFVD